MTVASTSELYIKWNTVHHLKIESVWNRIIYAIKKLIVPMEGIQYNSTYQVNNLSKRKSICFWLSVLGFTVLKLIKKILYSCNSRIEQRFCNSRIAKNLNKITFGVISDLAVIVRFSFPPEIRQFSV